ncbi:MAG: AraC family transcriptional regulator [Treponema sp.]|jgi:AraC-like DNA-binding protein|nr:AraC family transcriptional regulator [Treponema sp.]
MELAYHFYHKNEFRPLVSLSLQELAGFDCPAGYVLPLKKPDVYALYFVVKGKGVYTLAGTEYPAQMGDIFALYPNTTIKCRADKKKPWTLYTVSFDGADARLMLNAAQLRQKTPLRHLDDFSCEQIARIFGAMNGYREQELYATIYSTCLLYCIMSYLVKSVSWEKSQMPASWTGAVHFRKAIKFIDENYSRSITVDDIAAHVALSRSRLYRLFMQHVFMPPQQYLMEFRVREGLNLLEKRAGSVKEIALAVGLEDQGYFTKLFKKITGKSPTDYMKGQIEENEQLTKKKETRVQKSQSRKQVKKKIKRKDKLNDDPDYLPLTYLGN